MSKRIFKELYEYNISFSTIFLNIFKIIEMLKKDDIILNKNYYKTRNNIWDDKKQSKFIESLILRMPISCFYFEENEKGNYIVIDGWQRLNTLHDFINTKELYLNNLNYINTMEFEGYFFENLPVYIQRRILEQNFTIYTINRNVPQNTKNDIIERIQG